MAAHFQTRVILIGLVDVNVCDASELALGSGEEILRTRLRGALVALEPEHGVPAWRNDLPLRLRVGLQPTSKANSADSMR